MDRHSARGLAIAAALTGSWRSSLPAWDGTAGVLAAIAPLLMATGAGGLAWARVRRSPLKATETAKELHQAYRLHTLQAALQQQYLCDLLTRLREAGIEPLIVKGWSVARLYPEAGLRPAGDIDLCVRPADLERAMAVLTQAAGQCGSVDLHVGIADLDRPLEEVYARSRLAPLGAVEVRMLGAEDQLRHLCLHLMRHGGWRALWLCDVAAALESTPAGFDWGYCLTGQRWRSEWVRCTIGLAQELLGAGCCPAEIAGRASPSWMIGSVLESWGQGAASNDAVGRPIRASLGSWRAFREGIGQRWPNPIRAAFKLRRGPHGRAILATQLTAFLTRGSQYLMSRLRGGQLVSQLFDVHPSQVR